MSHHELDKRNTTEPTRLFQTQKESRFIELQQDNHRALEALAQTTEANLHTERQQLIPSAQRSLQETIIPWWQKFEQSGELEDLMGWSTDHGARLIQLNNPIIYPEKPDGWQIGSSLIANSIIYGGDEPDTNDWITGYYTKKASQPALHEAHFYIRGEAPSNRIQNPSGLLLITHPLIVEDGFHTQTVTPPAQTNLRREDAPMLSSIIHPEVLLEFADHINAGNIWNSIMQSMQPQFRDEREPVNLVANQRRAEKYFATKPQRYANYLAKK